MSFDKLKMNPVMTVLMVFFAFCSVGLLSCKKKSTESKPVIPSNPNVKRESAKSVKVDNRLTGIISDARGWGPILSDWYGKQMPDFKFRDIAGKSHNLSDYKGRKVMIVMWATWCMPCREEVPHLIALRNIISPDKLAIIAISNESESKVRNTAKQLNMNYTVVSHKDVLPAPLKSIRGYPSAFFINPDGSIKIITEGGLMLGEMKAIVSAK